jgi:GIY-YIG catalytic domain/NUMOD3 motif
MPSTKGKSANMVIYKITNKINGLSYIGQTTNTVEFRFMHHVKPHKTRKTYLSRAIAKYGKENFSYIILSECENIDQLNDAEIYWIDFLQTLSPSGYNLTEGGKNTVMSAQTRNKMSIAKLGKRSNAFGKSLSAEHKAKISAFHKGRSPITPKAKVQCIETSQTFDSMLEAAGALSVRQGHISEVCSGNRKTAGGYTFRKVG